MGDDADRDRVEFHLTDEHFFLLTEVHVRWSNTEYGAPEIDPKRPLGNSGSRIPVDMCEALGITPISDRENVDVDVDKKYTDEEKREAEAIFSELDTALQIVLSCQTFRTGLFEREQFGDWQRVSVSHGDDCPVCGEPVNLSAQGMTTSYTCYECEATYWWNVDS